MNISKDSPIVIGQNVGFDLNFVNTRARRNLIYPLPILDDVFDTRYLFMYILLPIMQASIRILYDDRAFDFISNYPMTKNKTPSVSMGIISEKLKVNNKNWHSAIADVEILIECLIKTLNLIVDYSKIFDSVCYDEYKKFQTNALLIERYYAKGKKKMSYPKLY